MGITQKLLFTDTDSLAYEIKTKDFYKDINPDIEKRFDTSDYPTNHLPEIKTGFNSKVLGMLRMKLVGSKLLNLLVRELNFTLTKCWMALKKKIVRGDKKCYKKEYSIR